MLFSLKNVGAISQRLVNKILKNQIGRHIEIYIDDMLVKSSKEINHIKTWRSLQRPSSTADKVEFEQVRFRCHSRQIPRIYGYQTRFEKIRRKSRPFSTCGIQLLRRKCCNLLDTLSLSIDSFQNQLRSACHSSRSYGKCTTSIERRNANKHLSWSSSNFHPYFPSSKSKRSLYLAVALEVVNSILVRMDNKGIQKSIYHTSRVLHDTETKYSKPKKIFYALIISALS